MNLRESYKLLLATAPHCERMEAIQKTAYHELSMLRKRKSIRVSNETLYDLSVDIMCNLILAIDEAAPITRDYVYASCRNILANTTRISRQTKNAMLNHLTVELTHDVPAPEYRDKELGCFLEAMGLDTA